MISTDDVKKAASELSVLDPQSIAEQLDKLQSQQFVDPNCAPGDKQSFDVLNDSFCADPLQGRDARLVESLGKLPIEPELLSQAECAQTSLNKIQDLIKTKYSFNSLQEDIKKNNFAEEKVEAQLAQISFVTVFVYAIAQVAKIPNLVESVKALIAGAMIIQDIETTEKINTFEKQYVCDRLLSLSQLFADVQPDKRVYDVREEPIADFNALQDAILHNYTTPVMIKEFNSYLKVLDSKITSDERKSTKSFCGTYQTAADKLVISEVPSIDDYFADVVRFKRILADEVFSNILDSATAGTIKKMAFFVKATADIEAPGRAQTINEFLTLAYDDLITFFTTYINETPKPPTERDVLAEVGKLDFCGTPLPSDLPPEDDTPTTPNIADLAWITFDVNNRPTITDVKYWKRYAMYLSIVNLLPAFYTIGLYVPTTAGILKIPLPTIWKPLVVINAKPLGLIVIFLTINGIVISPTVWLWKFPPFGKNDTSLAVMLRAFNKKIKDDTGDELLNVPVVNGINVNPELTKSLPFKKDDVPAIARLGMNNLPYVNYLRQWLTTYKTGGGLP